MTDQLHSLEGVLRGKLLTVADYQRPYAWEEKQLSDLWDDLDLLGKSTHYAGTLVLRRTADAPREASSGETLETFEIVDGQQRVTTCMILLDRLRVCLGMVAGQWEGEGAADASDTVYDLQRLLTLKIDGVECRRLSLAGELDAFWSKTILGQTPHTGATLTDGQGRLRSAKDFFDKKLLGITADVEPAVATARLIDLRSRVTSKLRFLVYDVASSAEVGVLFETLNERGKGLSELEKVKNYLLYLARQLDDSRSSDLARTINAAWAEIFTNLAGLPVDDDALLSGHWFATQDHQPRNWQRTGSIKAKFPRSTYVESSDRLATLGVPKTGDEATEVADLLYADVADYVESLRRCSAFLRDFHSEDAGYPDFDSAVAGRVQARSTSLVRSNVSFPFRPLIFAGRLACGTDGEFLEQLLTMCETFSARVFAICQFRTNAGRTTLAKIAHDLYVTGEKQAALDALAECLWYWAPDDRVRSEFVEDKDWYHRRGHKYVLYEYELAVNHEAPRFRQFVDTGKRRTTEHVLPQDPAPGSQWLADFGPAERERLVHGIGNLVLTWDNSSYGRKDYAAKRGSGTTTSPCYLHPKALGRERELGQAYEVWTPVEVRDRLEQISSWALARWPAVAPRPVVGVDELEADAEEDEAEEASSSAVL